VESVPSVETGSTLINSSLIITVSCGTHSVLCKYNDSLIIMENYGSQSNTIFNDLLIIPVSCATQSALYNYNDSLSITVSCGTQSALYKYNDSFIITDNCGTKSARYKYKPLNTNKLRKIYKGIFKQFTKFLVQN
jgi:hypothetical protein